MGKSACVTIDGGIMTPDERDRLTRVETYMDSVKNAILDQKRALERLSEDIEKLTAAANKGRGAVAVLLGLGSVIGGTLTWGLQHLFTR